MESDVTESAQFYKAWAWAETHKKQLIWGTVVVAVAALIAGFIFWQRGEKEAAANAALSGVLMSSDAPTATTPEALLKVAAEHGDTPAAQRALLLAGTDYFVANKFPEAQAQFEKYLRDYGDSPYSSQALLGVAACLDAEGKTNEALTAYRNVVDRRANDNVAPQARFALGRLLEAQGKFAEAHELYEGLYKGGSYTALGQEAGVRASELMAKHPELAPKPIAPAATSPVVTIPSAKPAPAPSAAGSTNH